MRRKGGEGVITTNQCSVSYSFFHTLAWKTVYQSAIDPEGSSKHHREEWGEIEGEEEAGNGICCLTVGQCKLLDGST